MSLPWASARGGAGATRGAGVVTLRSSGSMLGELLPAGGEARDGGHRGAVLLLPSQLPGAVPGALHLERGVRVPRGGAAGGDDAEAQRQGAGEGERARRDAAGAARPAPR